MTEMLQLVVTLGGELAQDTETSVSERVECRPRDLGN